TVVVYQIGGKQTAPNTELTASTAAKPATKVVDEKPATVGTKFDFFTLLPEREVIVTTEATQARPIKVVTATANTTKESSKPEADTVAESNEKYNLQAGSFRQTS